MSDVIYSPSVSRNSGPGVTSISGGTGTTISVGKSPGSSIGNSPSYFGADYIPNSYNMNIANTARRNYENDYSDIMNYNNLMYHTALKWSENMSNTAIQRQVQDLIKAGLNPVLATKLGGASYSLPSTPYMGMPQYQSIPTYDSSISRQESINETQLTNNIRDNLTRMSITEIEQFNANIRNELDNETSKLNTKDRIQADKDIAEYDRETSRIIERMKEIQESIENEKDRDSAEHIARMKQYSEEYKAQLDYLAKIYSSGILSIGNIFSSGIGAIGRIGGY